MTFPSPVNSNGWQTAYTKDQARRDSLGRFLLLYVPLGILYLIGVIFAYARVIQIRETIPSTLLYILLAVGVSSLAILIVFLVNRAAFKSSLSFLQEFYQPPEDVDLLKAIRYRIKGSPPLPPPLNMINDFKSIVAQDGQILKPDEWPAWMAQNLGGPLKLNISDGTALYVEKGNRFSRIIGPGKNQPFLMLHETIKYAISYRSTIKEGEISVWTKDGINIVLTVRLECQVGAPSSAASTINLPESDALVYRFDPTAIKKAIEWTAVRRPSPDLPPIEVDWAQIAWERVMAIFPKHIGGFMLDELLLAEQDNGQILSTMVTQRLQGHLNKETQPFGVYVTSLQIKHVRNPSEVDEQRRLVWEAERQGIAKIIDGQSKASSIRSREKARAEAQKDLILAIADGLEKNKSKNYVEPVLLSLSRILDESLQNPQTRANLAKETLETLEKIQKMLDK